MFQGDAIIKTAIEMALDDMRKQPWLIEDCFRDLMENKYLAQKYGVKAVHAAKEWFANNRIDVYLKERIDKQNFPCVTISIGSGNEAEELATLGDTDIITESYGPGDIGRPIPFIVKPFKPISFDKTTGIVEMPQDIEEYKYISPDMVAIDPKTGEGYPVIEKAGTYGFKISTDAVVKDELAIIPQYCFWNAKRESIESKYTFNIGCHVHGDANDLIYLFDIVKYGFLRYREALFEHSGFQLSTLTFTDFMKNKAFGEENVYSRWISVKGQVNESWVKGPKRIIEVAVLEDPDGTTGLKACSNTTPAFADPDLEPWIAVDTSDDGE